MQQKPSRCAIGDGSNNFNAIVNAIVIVSKYLIISTTNTRMHIYTYVSWYVKLAKRISGGAANGRKPSAVTGGTVVVARNTILTALMGGA